MSKEYTFIHTMSAHQTELKVGSWGKGKNKRVVKEMMVKENSYLISLFSHESNDLMSNSRIHQSQLIKPGVLLHMPVYEKTFEYTGLVKSNLRPLSRDELMSNYPELIRAAWSNDELDRRDIFFQLCEVEWHKTPLTTEMLQGLKKTIRNGGRVNGNIRNTIVPMR
jgi:hypothetical protein